MSRSQKYGRDYERWLRFFAAHWHGDNDRRAAEKADADMNKWLKEKRDAKKA